MAQVALPKDNAAAASKQSVIYLAIPALIAAAALAVSFAYYLPFLADDALISLRYSQRLLQGHGLTWTAGSPPVEGYSNLLWVLLVAAGGLAGLDLVDAARLFGLLGIASAAAALLYRSRKKAVSFAGMLPPLAGMLMIVLAGPAGAWAAGGLEQPLLAALLAWGLVLAEPLYTQVEHSPGRLLLPGLFFALLALTRPDGILFAGMAVLALFFARGINRASIRDAVLLALLPGLFLLGQLAFRLAYYGEWVPNTALVKVSLSRAHLRDGLIYLQGGLLSLSPLIQLAGVWLLAAVFIPAHRRANWALLLSLGAWLGYIALVGGDIFPAWRHLVPVVVIAGLLLTRGLEWLLPRLGPKWLPTSALLLAALVGAFAYIQVTDPENRRAEQETWEWDGKTVGLMLKDSFGAQAPLLAVEPGGCVPFWSELPAVDMLGLNDYYLPRHLPADFGQGWIGHELGNGEYVLSRKPDLVLFCLPFGSADPCYRSGKEMTENPAFYQDYSLVKFQVPGAGQPARLWVRRDGVLGMQPSAEGVQIPAYFIDAGETAAASRSQGEWQVEVSQNAAMPGLRLTQGRWTVRVLTAPGSPEVRLSIYPAGAREQPLLLNASGAGGSVAITSLARRLDVVLASTDPARPAVVRGIQVSPAR